MPPGSPRRWWWTTRTWTSRSRCWANAWMSWTEHGRKDARTQSRQTFRHCVLPSTLRLCGLASVLRRFALFVAAIALSAVPPFRLSAQREPVLKQIRIPHAYYYREMYLPQATSGPSAVAWSPDGRELVYTMQGSLWRQRLGAPEAGQLTDGPGYDYQPDWSPDGTSVVYTSYRNDAMELRLLDLASGADRALVADGAVNLDPRFSPDGHRVAFVSTALQARWHVFVVELDATGRAAAGPPVRLTADNDSRLPRYYYSVYDHYLSPAWSPDGKELILVSNRGHVWGSGGLWRMEARPDAPMREIRSEETTWKARPDWSRDGRRVVYSSYLGRQRNQLWLTTADGGDPLQLTYCECDHTAPRWSPDGGRIAFVSNEEGNPSLRVGTVPGGAVETVAQKTRRYLHATGTLRIVVTDPAGTPIAARLSVTGPDGRGRAPDGAWRHADDGFARSERKFERTYFHATGRATLTLPAGEYAVEATRGLEYARVVRKVTVAAAATDVVPIRLARLVDLPARGWWSGDLHVHMNYGGAYRNDPARLRAQAHPEDLHVGEHPLVNKEHRIPVVAVLRLAGAPRGGLPGGRRVQRPPRHRRGLVPPAQHRLPAPRGRRDRRDGQFRLAARAGRDEPRLRALGPEARLPRLARRAQGGALLRLQRPAPRLHAQRARGGRRDRPAGRRPPAHRAGVAAFDGSHREARDRRERRRRGADSPLARRRPCGRRDPLAGHPERLVHPPRLVLEVERGSARHLSLCHHQPGLRHPRRPAGALGGGCPLVREMDGASGSGGRGAHRVEHRGGEEGRPRSPRPGEGGVSPARGGGGTLGQEREPPRHRLDGERPLDLEFLPVRLREHCAGGDLDGERFAHRRHRHAPHADVGAAVEAAQRRERARHAQPPDDHLLEHAVGEGGARRDA